MNDETGILQDGRLAFVSEEDFQSFYNELKSEDFEDVAKKLEDFYAADFYSLLPVLTDKNEETQASRHLAKINENYSKSSSSKGNGLTEKETLDYFGDLEDMFGEETFAALINDKGEIQVNRKIYKYTDVGLFIVPKNQINKLNEFLSKKNVAGDFTTSTSDIVRNEFIAMFGNCDDKAITISDSGVGISSLQYYVHPGFRCGVGINSEGDVTGKSNSDLMDKSTPDEIRAISAGLKICSGSKPWLANLFGTTKICDDQYDKDHNLKIKYYTNNYVLGYSIGVKVKHQKKGWTGIWREQKAEEMAVGINSVTWAYNKVNVFPTNLNFPAIWYFNGDNKVYSSQLGAMQATYVGIGGAPLLELPFVRDADLIVEIVTNDFGFLKTEKEVRKFFYDNVYNSAKSLLKSYRNKDLRKAVAIINANQQTWIQYYDFTYQCENCDEYQRVFDWGAVTPKITYKFGGTNGFGGGTFKPSFESFDFKNPKVTGINMYGMSKNYGKWHGSNLVF